MSYRGREWYGEENDGYELYRYFRDDELCKCENRINVNGKGSVKAAPDIVIVNMGIENEGKDLNAVQKENAETAERVIRTLVKQGIDERDIETASYLVEPVYDYIGGKQVFRGYRVKNMLRVTIRDMVSAGRIIDAAVKNGVNNVSSIDFDISEKEGYYYQALKLAVEDAVRKAEVISRTMGVNVIRVPVNVFEESYGPIPMVLSAFTETKAAVTPIRPKRVEITASVKAVFRYDNE